MHQVQYDEFIRVWGHKLDDEFRDSCIGSSFFLVNGGAFALKFKRKVCFVVLAVGNGLDMFRQFIKWAKQRKFTALVFYFKKNSPTSGLVKYCNGRRWISRYRFQDGETAYLGMVRLNCQRLRHG